MVRRELGDAAEPGCGSCTGFGVAAADDAGGDGSRAGGVSTVGPGSTGRYAPGPVVRELCGRAAGELAGRSGADGGADRPGRAAAVTAGENSSEVGACWAGWAPAHSARVA